MTTPRDSHRVEAVVSEVTMTPVVKLTFRTSFNGELRGAFEAYVPFTVPAIIDAVMAETRDGWDCWVELTKDQFEQLGGHKSMTGYAFPGYDFDATHVVPPPTTQFHYRLTRVSRVVEQTEVVIHAETREDADERASEFTGSDRQWKTIECEVMHRDERLIED